MRLVARERHRPVLAQVGAELGGAVVRLVLAADVRHAHAEAAPGDVEQPRGLTLERRGRSAARRRCGAAGALREPLGHALGELGSQEAGRSQHVRRGRWPRGRGARPRAARGATSGTPRVAVRQAGRVHAASLRCARPRSRPGKSRAWSLVGAAGVPSPQRRAQLPAGADAELGEDLAQVVLDGARADEQLRADLRVRLAVGGEPGDLRLLGREDVARRRRCAWRRSRRWPRARGGRARRTPRRRRG